MVLAHTALPHTAEGQRVSHLVWGVTVATSFVAVGSAIGVTVAASFVAVGSAVGVAISRADSL